MSFIISMIATVICLSSMLFERRSGESQFLAALGLGIATANIVWSWTKHAAPAERTSSGEAGDVKPGAAPTNLAPVAASHGSRQPTGGNAAGDR